MRALGAGAAALWLLWAGSAAGQALADGGGEDVCFSRPGRSTDPCTVSRGGLQLETTLAGVARTRGEADSDESVFGESVLRYGLTDSTDVELSVTPLSRSGGEAGFGDTGLLLKHRFSDADADRQAGLAAFVTAPTATNGQGDGVWTGGVLLPLSLAAGPWSFVATPQAEAAADADGGGVHLQTSLVLAASRELGFGFTGGAELYGVWDDDPAAESAGAALDLFVAWSPPRLPRLQLDAGLNIGLDPDLPDVEAYLGVARRF